MRFRAFATFLLLAASSLTAFAQDPAPPAPVPRGALKLFLDCQYQCDTEFIIKELAFVDHVRDSQSADIHALVTTESTGGGGTRWTIRFIGLGAFKGHDETASFTTPQTATPDEQRKEVVRWLKLGLATHAAMAAGATGLDVTYTAAKAATEAVHDPWHAWVFSLNVNGHMSGEATSKFASYNLNASASRVTDAWKVSVNNYWNRNTNEFEVDDGEIVESLSSSWQSTVLVVKSLTPQWSAAIRAGFEGSTYQNYDLRTRTLAGVEYNVFPYSESTRRALTFSYLAGLATYDFEEVTIYDKLSERKFEHQLAANLGLRQPWGSVGFESTFTQHLDDPGKTRLNIYGDADVRLFKGFSFNVFGNYSRIRDQINLRKSDVAEEEVLLRLRQLATGYSYFMGFGISYRFGSIHNNVVNTRFRNF
jgi:hypothetical protein